jgi:hypothetical protein
MAQPVTLESDALRVEVWPQFGGKVSSVVDKADGFELLFNYPAELPSGPKYDSPYGKGWYAGWDECFPAVAPGMYDRHPYQGVHVPDHGELWGLPALSVPAKGGITTVWHGLRFGYRLTRKLTLDPDAAVLTAEYTLVNLAPFEFHFVWAMHALMAMTTPVELSLGGVDGAGQGASPAFRWSHDADGTDIQSPFDWPMAAEGVDLSRPDALPPRQGWKVFSAGEIAGPATVRYPSRSRSLRIHYASSDGLPAHWGIWINTGGWAGHRHFAVEPTTGRFDQIDRAINDHSAGRVKPLARRDWSVKWELRD